MALRAKCASVLRCPGGAKRTWAIYATYVRSNRPQSTIIFWQSSHRSLTRATIEGSMALRSKCGSVLRCPGGAKRTCAYIKQTYGRRNRPQSTIRFWQSSHRTVLSVRVKILNTRKRAWGGSLVGFFMPSAAEPALLDASICLHALAVRGVLRSAMLDLAEAGACEWCCGCFCLLAPCFCTER